MISHSPDDRIGLMIIDIARLQRKCFEQALAEVESNIAAADARVLSTISRRPNLRQAALAEHLGVEPMTLVGNLDALEARGLVKRIPDPEDRRAKLIRLTEKASPVLALIDQALERVRAIALAGFDPDDEAMAKTLLGGIRSNLAEASARGGTQ